MDTAAETELKSLVEGEVITTTAKNLSAPIESCEIAEPQSEVQWTRVVMYTLFVLFAQPAATLLGRLYFSKGGKNIFLSSSLETIGFPILIPFLLYRSPSSNLPNNHNPTYPPFQFIRTTTYLLFGTLQATQNILYAIGLQNLPVSTFSLVSSTELAFNVFFSMCLNGQKLTFMIVNSIILLTISSGLLVYNNENEQSERISKRKQSMGFACTLIASALYALLQSLTQQFFQKMLKEKTVTDLLNLIIYQSFVATCIILVVLFASRQWTNNFMEEMEHFEFGKASYIILLVSISISWQVFSIGAVGLTFEVSSLFSNVIGTVSLPTVPILAAIFFHDKMDRTKVVSLVLALLGFIFHVYQHYIDSTKTDHRRYDMVYLQRLCGDEINEKSNDQQGMLDKELKHCIL